MNTILRSAEFDAWLSKLRDLKAMARILARIRSAGFGTFGDWKSVGGSVMEMRINTGPGYRIYYVRRAETVYLLLAGGEKSTQERDIRRAVELAKALRGDA